MKDYAKNWTFFINYTEQLDEKYSSDLKNVIL